MVNIYLKEVSRQGNRIDRASKTFNEMFFRVASREEVNLLKQ